MVQLFFCSASREITHKNIKKVREVCILPYCRQAPVPPIFMKFGVRGQVTDIITYVKFLVNRFRGYRVLIPSKLPFPIDLLHRPYNCVHTTVRHCDTVDMKAFYVMVTNKIQLQFDRATTIRRPTLQP